MHTTKQYLAFDLGASNGRAILGTFSEGSFEMQVIHRFPTPVVDSGERLYWDASAIEQELLYGLQEARRIAGSINSLSVTSWGVDYVPLDSSGKCLRDPYCYRDSRTRDMPLKVYKEIPESDFYRVTGIGTMSINTVFQLCWERDHDPVLFRKSSHRLTVADYFNYLFSGQKVIERSLASTTQMLDAKTGDWAEDLLSRAGIPAGNLAPVVPSATVLGPVLNRFQPLQTSAGYRPEQVVASCSHDTACAMATALTLNSGADRVFLSSGTWSLLGLALKQPVLTDEARKAGFTNESGPGDTIRFLKNLTGLWVLQECEREWQEDGVTCTYEELMQEAAAEAKAHTPPVINLEAPPFAEPGQMIQKIAAFCQKNSLPVPENRGAIVAAILHSLAHTYARTITTLERLTGRSVRHLHVVGGGSKNHLLCQWTADITGCQVFAGPVEASAIGNLLLQARALGDLPGVGETMTMLQRFEPVTVYSPDRP